MLVSFPDTHTFYRAGLFQIDTYTQKMSLQ